MDMWCVFHSLTCLMCLVCLIQGCVGAGVYASSLLARYVCTVERLPIHHYGLHLCFAFPVLMTIQSAFTLPVIFAHIHTHTHTHWFTDWGKCEVLAQGYFNMYSKRSQNQPTNLSNVRKALFFLINQSYNAKCVSQKQSEIWNRCTNMYTYTQYHSELDRRRTLIHVVTDVNTDIIKAVAVHFDNLKVISTFLTHLNWLKFHVAVAKKLALKLDFCRPWVMSYTYQYVTLWGGASTNTCKQHLKAENVTLPDDLSRLEYANQTCMLL